MIFKDLHVFYGASISQNVAYNWLIKLSAGQWEIFGNYNTFLLE